MTVEFTTAMLCDMVRQEMNGKFIAIGIYSSSVIFAGFPAIGQFQVFAKSRISQPGKHSLHVRTLVSGEEDQHVEAEMEVEKPSNEWLVLPLQPIQFKVPGPFTLEYRTEAENG
jgi:hypothetical protein